MRPLALRSSLVTSLVTSWLIACGGSAQDGWVEDQFTGYPDGAGAGGVSGQAGMSGEAGNGADAGWGGGGNAGWGEGGNWGEGGGGSWGGNWGEGGGGSWGGNWGEGGGGNWGEGGSGPGFCGDLICDPSETCSSCSVDCCVPPTCGDGLCDVGEHCGNCPGDCCENFCGNNICEPGESCDWCSDCCVNTVCGNGTCDKGESCFNCAQDCCKSTCGNGVCEAGEDCANCAGDCCAGPTCGNGTCEVGESCGTCAKDCCSTTCGNGVCEAGESCESCAKDCCSGPVCGDGFCELGESCNSCKNDCCNWPTCGDGVCDPSESCGSCSKDCGACGCTHDVCVSGQALDASCTTCTQQVCAIDPFCCTENWDFACVDEAKTVCGACGVVTPPNPLGCTVTDGNLDFDKDGWSINEGDCNDCDPNVNPGAIDIVNYYKLPDGTPTTIPLADSHQIDEDCSGTARLPSDDVSCDAGLGPVALSPYDAARAMGLCSLLVPANPTSKKDAKWGVIEAKFSDISGPFMKSPLPQSLWPMTLNFGLLNNFGAATTPFEGQTFFALSSGQARAPGQLGFVPNMSNSLDKGYSSPFPIGFPKEGTCGTTGLPYDGVALDLKIRVPTNAKSFSFQFRFFSSEYPTYTCQVYNDVFAVLMDPSPLPPGDPMSPNIAFETMPNGIRNVIGVNNQSFFTACKPVAAGYTKCEGDEDLKGTGFEEHAASAWLRSLSPVTPGSVINLRFAIWDSADGAYDSTVVVDDFRWRAEGGKLGTEISDEEPEQP